MTYAFRKYLNKRGSALFMVLSLMTALMILVMAMYFSVVSSRDVQYKVFYQEQAYRSATSLSDAIVAGLKGNSWQTATGSNSLLSAITGMAEGDMITTNGNDFKAFVTTGTKEEQDQLGAYTVSISRMADENIDNQKTRVYDVAITTSTGGVIDTTHTFIHVVEPEGEASQGKTNIFTSTGYVPNDVYLHGVETWTDLFYDNEYVMITSENHVYSNLYAGGSVVFNKASAVPADKSKTATWAIRNNFTNNSDKFNLGTSTEKGLLLVGGNLTLNGQNAKFENMDVYVLGDVYIEKSATLDNSCRFFVGGGLYLKSGAGGSNLHCDIYANKIVKSASCNGGNLKGGWLGMDQSAIPSDAMTSHDMAMKLDALTASIDYAKWKVNDDTPTGKHYIDELSKDSPLYNKKTISFDKEHQTVYLNWQGKVETDYFGQGQHLNYSAVVIDDIVANYDGWDPYCPTLVIDTGDDPKNQYFIKTLANRDMDGDDENETFEWAPETSSTGTNYTTMTVIVRGKGSVVIDVPEGVTYQASDSTWVIHETWYAILGGAIEQRGAGGDDTLAYTQASKAGLTVNAEKVMDFTHSECDEDCAVCDYQESKGECSKCKAQTMITLECDAHDMTYSFCPDCQPAQIPEKSGNKYYGLCANRVERSAVDTAVAGLDATWQSRLIASGDGTDWYYPTNNIFIVSCDESADIRLASDVNGNRFVKQALFGFVYAPYMTYKGEGGNGAGWVIFCGGMIVSDYIISEFDVYLACYPELLPQDLMNAQNRQEMLDPIAPKTWKISLAGY